MRELSYNRFRKKKQIDRCMIRESHSAHLQMKQPFSKMVSFKLKVSTRRESFGVAQTRPFIYTSIQNEVFFSPRAHIVFFFYLIWGR